MALQDGRDSLDVLQNMFNEVLIQTGKALRASCAGMGSQPNVQPKLPDTLRTFHSALDDLENEIIRAKSVMQRDLSRLQANKGLSAPQPVEAQSKSPMVIDIDSSPAKEQSDGFEVKKEPETKIMAPFPDMGMDLSVTDGLLNSQSGPSPPTTIAPQAEMKPEVEIPASAPAVDMDLTRAEVKADDAPSGGPAAEAPMAFTDMQFSLAPPTDNINPGGQDQAFDLSTFDTTNIGTGAISLDNNVPQDSVQQTQMNGDALGQSQAPTDTQFSSGVGTGNIEGFDSGTFDDINPADFANADGTDFDFGMEGNSFDALMDTHDQNYDNTMEHGQFDADFFGLNQGDDM